MQLYLVKETVLHRLGKARTEWQEAMNEQQFEQLLDSIVPGPKLLFQDTARSYCRIFWRSYNESSLAAGYHCREEEWRRKVLRLHVQWNCCRRVLSLLSHIRQRFRISWRFPQAKNSRPPHQSAKYSKNYHSPLEYTNKLKLNPNTYLVDHRSGKNTGTNSSCA